MTRIDDVHAIAQQIEPAMKAILCAHANDAIDRDIVAINLQNVVHRMHLYRRYNLHDRADELSSSLRSLQEQTGV